LNTAFGDYCEPVDFGSLGETVKARLVAKQGDADEEAAFVMNTEKFTMPT
jgi:hypothetical protein